MKILKSYNKKYLYKSKEGLTLVGVMVSLTMISVSLASLIYLAARNSEIGIRVYNQAEANSLVYDGFEVIRGIRDKNVQKREGLMLGDEETKAAGKDFCQVSEEDLVWDEGFVDDGFYYVYYNSDLNFPDYEIKKYNGGDITLYDEVSDRNAGEALRLYLKDGLYTHNPSSEKTKYHRIFYIENQGEDQFICNTPYYLYKKITIKVWWWTALGEYKEVVNNTYLSNLENIDVNY